MTETISMTVKSDGRPVIFGKAFLMCYGGKNDPQMTHFYLAKYIVR